MPWNLARDVSHGMIPCRNAKIRFMQTTQSQGYTTKRNCPFKIDWLASAHTAHAPHAAKRDSPHAPAVAAAAQLSLLASAQPSLLAAARCASTAALHLARWLQAVQQQLRSMVRQRQLRGTPLGVPLRQQAWMLLMEGWWPAGSLLLLSPPPLPRGRQPPGKHHGPLPNSPRQHHPAAHSLAAPQQTDPGTTHACLGPPCLPGHSPQNQAHSCLALIPTQNPHHAPPPHQCCMLCCHVFGPPLLHLPLHLPHFHLCLHHVRLRLPCRAPGLQPHHHRCLHPPLCWRLLVCPLMPLLVLRSVPLKVREHCAQQQPQPRHTGPPQGQHHRWGRQCLNLYFPLLPPRWAHVWPCHRPSVPAAAGCPCCAHPLPHAARRLGPWVR